MKKCFLICPIGESNSETRKHSDKVMKYLIKPICDKYEYNLFRSDKENTTNKIDDEIFDHLDNDDLAIADLTNLNPNVFYEAGYRNARGLPLIQIAKDGTTLPFDVGRIRTYFYDLDIEKAEEFKHSLSKVIESILSCNTNQYNQLPNFAVDILNIIYSIYISNENKGIAQESATLLGTPEEIISKFHLTNEYIDLIFDFLRSQQYIKFEYKTLIRLTDKTLTYYQNNFNALFQRQINILAIIRNLFETFNNQPFHQNNLANFTQYTWHDIEMLKLLGFLICYPSLYGIDGPFLVPTQRAYGFS